MKGTYSWVTMSVVLLADILNIVLYNMDYSSLKCVPESWVLNQALRKFILPPLCPSSSPLRVQILQVAVTSYVWRVAVCSVVIHTTTQLLQWLCASSLSLSCLS